MPTTAITFGILLILTGVVGYVYGMMNDRASVTALIPAFIGIVLAALGLAAQAKESLRKHLMHVAVIVALLGFIATGGRLLMKISEFALTPPVIATLVTAVICLAFVILAVRSFAKSRADA